MQTADADKVRIQLRDMPSSPRTNETTRLSYSLLSAREPDDLANGGGTPVGEELDTPTFDAPLSVLDEANPVNYYRIKLRFTIE